MCDLIIVEAKQLCWGDEFTSSKIMTVQINLYIHVMGTWWLTRWLLYTGSNTMEIVQGGEDFWLLWTSIVQWQLVLGAKIGIKTHLDF